MRIGIGFDIHRLVIGRDLILGGVKIPNNKGLLGHSDADCLCHALADSILGALALPNIGQLFPDDDESIRDISSVKILKQAVQMARDRGYDIVNLDTVLRAEQPRLTPFIPEMKATLATAIGLDPAKIGIKATSNEGLDAIGSGDAIACQAVCLLQQFAR
ncbi:MAG: 2-C-methyl-D-erythritol 2,4-cyclodiphosphate synthase [Puniceicoccales bacterium]|jgi:2-C-methyl-D-erythritol 2,4-cyclodiphosphate synthase|nr:2-C-methyl-D-erythritol 2,4-cyclodiphosphate synthase [Puniceicoccales bacterium]